MKKSLLTKSILAAGVLGAVVSANAAMGDLKFYAGAGLDYNIYGFNDSKDGIKSDGFGLAPVLGVKFHDNFGVEAGYSFNKKITTDADTVAKVKNMYLDLVGFMPAADQMEVIGGIGIGKVNAKKGDAMPHNSEIKNKFNWRAKIAAQYNFNSNFGTRISATYQNVGNKVKNTTTNIEEKFIKNIKSIGLGVFYTF